MKKIQIKLPVKDWGSTKSKYPQDSIYVGPDDFTANTTNVDTQLKGVITKPLGGTSYNPNSLLPTPAVDQFEMIFSDGTRHLLVMENGNLRYSPGNGIFSLVTSGYSAFANMEFAQYLDRAYFDNGVDNPQVYDKNTTYGGVTYTAPKTKNMGAQAPGATVTFAADSAGGNVPAGAHTYKVTFLYYGFEESNGGPSSAVHTVSNPNNTVNLTGVPIGGYGVTARKIYRDNNDGNYLLLGTINDNTTTIFTDTFLTGTTSIPTTNDTPPTFSYITNFLSRLWVAGVPGNPSTIYFSNAGLPDIFDPLNFIVCNPTDPIQAIVVYLDQLIILNRHSFGVITGTSSTDFAYSDVEVGIGCVDNRSVQVRTIEGVPKLVWLSDKGFYQYNGASFEYISNDIEDLVNFNISQGQVVKGHDSQNTQTQFQAGTITPSIDLDSDPGVIQQFPTSKTFQDEADWESGTLTNISTHDGSNTLKVPTQFAPNLADGNFNNITQSGNNLVLFTNTNASENYLSGSNQDIFIGVPIGQPIDPGRDGNGVVTSISVQVARSSAVSSVNFTVSLFSDSLNQPGSSLFTSSTLSTSSTSYTTFIVSSNVTVSSGSRYWIVISPSAGAKVAGHTGFIFQGLGNENIKAENTPGTWTNPSINESFAASYVVSGTSGSGQWTSTIYDSFSTSVSTGMSVTATGTYPSGTSSSLTVNGSNNSDMSSPNSIQTINNINGNVSLSLSGSRYWQIVIVETTNNNLNSPTVSSPVLFFNITGTWISPAIDRTTDIVSDDHLNIIDTVPVGTSITLTVATSANNITYTTFVPFGTEVVQRYMKIKAVLNTTSDNLTSPIVTSVETDWTVTGTFQSSIIDTGANPPAGWDIFQSTFQLNGGTISFFFRSASTSGGIPGATYQSVTNGTFPSNTPLEFCQWKAILTSSNTANPEISSVTVNWFISITRSTRVASIFYNRNYYISAEELGQPNNNIVLVIDDMNKWRIYSGISINTLSFFFNAPFYGDALTGNIIKWLQPGVFTNNGSAISMDVRTKAFDFAVLEKKKILRKVYVKLLNTGAVYNFYYSVDDGNTFLPLIIETQNGSTSLTTPNDGKLAFHRLLPVFPTGESGQSLQGKTIMFRITESTVNSVEFHELKAEAWIREGELLETT